MNDLNEEKAALEARIQENKDKIAECENAIHWDKKKLKIVNQQIAATEVKPSEIIKEVTDSAFKEK